MTNWQCFGGKYNSSQSITPNSRQMICEQPSSWLLHPTDKC
jgi:hypothetical protein